MHQAVTTYSSTKFALQGLSEAMALEYKPLTITVKTIAPGAFNTNFGAATDNNFENGDDEVKAYAQKLAHDMGIFFTKMSQQSGEDSNPQEPVTQSVGSSHFPPIAVEPVGTVITSGPSPLLRHCPLTQAPDSHMASIVPQFVPLGTRKTES